MRDIIKDNYLLSDDDTDLFISNRKTKDGGYKEQLWVIFRDFGHMFYSGREYLYLSGMFMSVEKVVQ
ncbi:MAG: hypothetical protein GWN62_17810 [Aliifodinibius sp.]|nr:hypothetical protein [Fodinibius sp.]